MDSLLVSGRHVWAIGSPVLRPGEWAQVVIADDDETLRFEIELANEGVGIPTQVSMVTLDEFSARISISFGSIGLSGASFDPVKVGTFGKHELLVRLTISRVGNGIRLDYCFVQGAPADG